MNQRVQTLFMWGGVGSFAFFIVGWVGLAGFLPPLEPSKSAADIAEIFDERRTGIRLGSVLSMVGFAMWIPFAAALAAQTRRSERDFPLLAWTQVACATAGAVVPIIGLLCWVVAAFRPERDPELTLLLSDLGFVITIIPFVVFVFWNVALALAIFGDKRAVPAFPRWAAWLCLWTAFLYVPGGCLAFFRTGPFAWDGALAFFLPATAFFVWIAVMTILGLKSIAREASRVATDLLARSARPAPRQLAGVADAG